MFFDSSLFAEESSDCDEDWTQLRIKKNSRTKNDVVIARTISWELKIQIFVSYCNVEFLWWEIIYCYENIILDETKYYLGNKIPWIVAKNANTSIVHAI